MATIFQKIFLSKKQQELADRKQEIMQIVSSAPIMHTSHITKTGGVVRCFSVISGDNVVRVEREYEQSRPFEQQVQYRLQMLSPKNVVFATHSSIDKLAEHVYTKMRKAWEKNNSHVK